jgi:heparanase 1
MDTKKRLEIWACAALTVLAGAMGSPVALGAAPASIVPSTMPRVGTVSERYQSFNIEMVEVTGGRF